MDKAQAEISPAVAMLVVVVVLCLSVGMLLFSMQHSSIGITAPGSELSRGRAMSPASRGASNARPAGPAQRQTEPPSPVRKY